MGLSNALSGGIVMVALISVLLTVPGIVGTTSIVQDASTEISDLETKIYHTNISISSLSPSLGSNVITYVINNDDSEKLWNFEKFDVIISFSGATSGPLTEKLTFAGVCSGNPAAGNWCINSFTNDILDPNVLNEGESINVRSSVSENLATGSVSVIFSTDYGATTTLASSV